MCLRLRSLLSNFFGKSKLASTPTDVQHAHFGPFRCEESTVNVAAATKEELTNFESTSSFREQANTAVDAERAFAAPTQIDQASELPPVVHVPQPFEMPEKDRSWRGLSGQRGTSRTALAGAAPTDLGERLLNRLYTPRRYICPSRQNPSDGVGSLALEHAKCFADKILLRSVSSCAEFSFDEGL